MGRVKIHRKKPSLDMTPMVDLAFLLVTFFMLTTKFRAAEPVKVVMPSSVSELKLPPTNIMIITLASDGRVFFDLSGQQYRKTLLENMGRKYNVQFTSDELDAFSVMSSFGVSIGSLKQFLDMKEEARKAVHQPGIPDDSTRQELKDWILYSRMANPKARIAVKGDGSASYPDVKKVIDNIEAAGVNRFNLITNLKRGKKSEGK